MAGLHKKLGTSVVHSVAGAQDPVVHSPDRTGTGDTENGVDVHVHPSKMWVNKRFRRKGCDSIPVFVMIPGRDVVWHVPPCHKFMSRWHVSRHVPSVRHP